MYSLKKKNVFGKIIESQPSIGVYDNALAIPFDWNSKICGLYDEYGNVVFESLNMPTKTINKMFSDRLISVGMFPGVGLESIKSAMWGGILHSHFGHFLIETLPRLWASKYYENIIFISKMTKEDIKNTKWMSDIFNYLKINVDSIKIINKPTKIKRIFVPNTSLGYLRYIHKEYIDFCHGIGISMGSNRVVRDKITYMSRSNLNSGTFFIENEIEIEDFLYKAGANICHPNSMSIREQVDCFNNSYVVSFIGSNFHLSSFSSYPCGIALFPKGLEIEGKGINYNYCLIDAANKSEIEYYGVDVEFAKNPKGNFNVGWRVKNIDDLCESINRKTVAHLENKNYKKSNVSYISENIIQYKFVDNEGRGMFFDLKSESLIFLDEKISDSDFKRVFIKSENLVCSFYVDGCDEYNIEIQGSSYSFGGTGFYIERVDSSECVCFRSLYNGLLIGAQRLPEKVLVRCSQFSIGEWEKFFISDVYE